MTILQHGIAQAAAGATGYQIARSLRFNSADSANLSRTFASAGNRKTWTVSGWIKKSALSTGTFFSARNGSTGDSFFAMRFEGADVLNIFDYTGSALNWQLQTTQVFRDFGAFFHIHLAVDTTQATAANRAKLYINGVQVTSFSTASYPSLNYDCYVNNAFAHSFGASNRTTIQEFLNYYLADPRFVDGQQLDPTSFGAFDANTGVWSPITYAGTYGTNGFWLKLDDNSGVTATTLGKDSSGNSNNWTPNNFSVTAGVGNDSLVDSPTNYGTDTGAGGEVGGNYCTWNPLFNPGNQTLANGNLDIATGTTGGSIGTMQVSTGKWYWEIIYTTAMTAGSRIAGIVKATVAQTSMLTNSVYWQQNATYSINNAAGVSYGTTPALNDVIGVALDVDAQTIRFYKNGVAMSTAISISSVYSVGDLVTPAMTQSAGTSQSCSANFGQRPFAYTAPSGFKALCTQNLPTPAIGATSSTLASKNMNVVTYTGNNTTNNITGVGFQPDLVWIKSRSNAVAAGIIDAVRGVRNNLVPSSTVAETLEAAGRSLTAFNADGFTLGIDNAGASSVNANAYTYVGWTWKGANATVSNTQGTITGTVSANPAAGISIVNWTSNGASAIETVGHGLGVTPAFVIIKNRDFADWWLVYHKSFSNTVRNYLQMNTTGAVATASVDYWGHTSTLLGVRQSAMATASGQRCIAYCFAEVAGFSKFGSYTGNGSTDGPFVYCGFRPKFVLVKNTDTGTEVWGILDSTRDTYNVANKRLYPNASNAENTGDATVVDFLSNGFKLRSTDAMSNASRAYIFAAFAEAPFNYARAR